MKKLFFIALFILPFLSFGEDFKQLQHNSISYVDDFANLFTPEEEKGMDNAIKKFKERSTVEFSIVTVNSLDGYDVEEFTLNLARKWGVGGKSNNGIMILLSKDPRKLRTEIGYGLEGDLPDVTALHFQQQYAVPYLKNNEYFKGISILLNAYMQHLDPVAKEQRKIEEAKQKFEAEKAWDSFLDVLIWIVCIAIGIYIVARTYKHIRGVQAKKELALKEAAVKAEREKLQKEQQWNNTIRKIELFKELIQKSLKYQLINNFVNQLLIIDRFDTTVKNDASRTTIQNAVNNIQLHDIESFKDQIEIIEYDLHKSTTINAEINELLEKYSKCHIILDNLIKLHPDLETGFKLNDINTIFTKTYAQIIELSLDIDKIKNDNKWDQLRTYILKYEELLRNCNSNITLVNESISSIENKKKIVASIPGNFSDFTHLFNKYKNLPYISEKFKSREQDFNTILNFYGKKLINDINTPHFALGLILLQYNNCCKELNSIIDIGRNEEEKEQNRLKAIQDEKDRKDREVKRIKEQEEEEERKKRKKRQDDEDDERRRRDSYSSSYSSSSWGSSSSDSSSSSDFGGGSFGGGGASSDY